MEFSRLNFPKSFHLYPETVYYGEGLDKKGGGSIHCWNYQLSKLTSQFSYPKAPTKSHSPQPSGARDLLAQPLGPRPSRTRVRPQCGRSLILEVGDSVL